MQRFIITIDFRSKFGQYERMNFTIGASNPQTAVKYALIKFRNLRTANPAIYGNKFDPYWEGVQITTSRIT